MPGFSGIRRLARAPLAAAVLAAALTAGPTAAQTGPAAPGEAGDSAGASAVVPLQAAHPVDAWGAERDFGRAIVELSLGNFLPWIATETFLDHKDIHRISPRIWEQNFKKAWDDWFPLKDARGYDDNMFHINHLVHPYQGTFYHSAFRTNNFGYWSSLPATMLGSVLWECCGESHFAAKNDFMTTTFGGAALGEVLYRATSLILKNEATGCERFWRELAAGLLLPIRGANRLASKRAWKTTPPTPASAQPESYRAEFAGGHLWQRADAALAGPNLNELRDETRRCHDVDELAFFRADLDYGSFLAKKRKGPFEAFRATVELTACDLNPFGSWNIARVDITGAVGVTPEAVVGPVIVRGMITHNLDYYNSRQFEFGGPRIGLGFVTGAAITRDFFLEVTGQADAMFAGINNEFSYRDQHVNQPFERLREYDFAGAYGYDLGAHLAWKTNRLADVTWQRVWAYAANGSATPEAWTRHDVKLLEARAHVPVPGSDSWGIGVDYLGFWRTSDFRSVADKRDQHSRVVRVGLVWHHSVPGSPPWVGNVTPLFGPPPPPTPGS